MNSFNHLDFTVGRQVHSANAVILQVIKKIEWKSKELNQYDTLKELYIKETSINNCLLNSVCWRQLYACEERVYSSKNNNKIGNYVILDLFLYTVMIHHCISCRHHRMFVSE